MSATTKIPNTVWALGFVSLFMDVSSEIIHALLPVFLTTTLGASVATVGLIDGVAEAAASVAKVFSGYWSDRIGRRKPFVFLGYALGALAKPAFALAGSPVAIFAARFADRIGKGVRGAPRDALIADVTPAAVRGRAFGLRQALDTAGAFAGPLLAIALMAAFSDDIRSVFWIAAIPAAISVALVVLGVEDRKAEGVPAQAPIRLSELRLLPRAFWRIAALSAVFTLARFSEAFLVLKANDEGLPLTWLPLVLVAMNAVYSLGAYPAGALSDRASPRRILLAGIATLILADLVLASGEGLSASFVGIALWGAHMALTQGLFARLVADYAPATLRGSAFGLFHLFTAAALLAASVIAGALWDRAGSDATFIASAAFAFCAGAALLTWTGTARV